MMPQAFSFSQRKINFLLLSMLYTELLQLFDVYIFFFYTTQVIAYIIKYVFNDDYRMRCLVILAFACCCTTQAWAEHSTTITSETSQHQQEQQQPSVQQNVFDVDKYPVSLRNCRMQFQS